ncbi:uncharacterized protein LOC108674990 isoform X2 [Hyalella azteca]|uniref:Uncharacterized protein LOC108674990 isoform X2 n=1 Tax=Hyalella azteca TaxID=294128 RepID=A0A8B7NXD9_HYAAZ|nr:uncharacterized protein LOC108674990 isoform X2 [Hyalella azteca]
MANLVNGEKSMSSSSSPASVKNNAPQKGGNSFPCEASVSDCNESDSSYLDVSLADSISVYLGSSDDDITEKGSGTGTKENLTCSSKMISTSKETTPSNEDIDNHVEVDNTATGKGKIEDINKHAEVDNSATESGKVEDIDKHVEVHNSATESGKIEDIDKHVEVDNSATESGKVEDINKCVEVDSSAMESGKEEDINKHVEVDRSATESGKEEDIDKHVEVDNSATERGKDIRTEDAISVDHCEVPTQVPRTEANLKLNEQNSQENCMDVEKFNETATNAPKICANQDNEITTGLLGKKRKLDDSDSDVIEIDDEQLSKKAKTTHISKSSTYKNGMFTNQVENNNLHASDDSMIIDDPEELPINAPKNDKLEKNATNPAVGQLPSQQISAQNQSSNKKSAEDVEILDSYVPENVSSAKLNSSKEINGSSSTEVSKEIQEDASPGKNSNKRKGTEENIEDETDEATPESPQNLAAILTPLKLDCTTEELSEVQSKTYSQFQSDYLMLLGILQNIDTVKVIDSHSKPSGRGGRARGGLHRGQGQNRGQDTQASSGSTKKFPEWQYPTTTRKSSNKKSSALTITIPTSPEIPTINTSKRTSRKSDSLSLPLKGSSAPLANARRARADDVDVAEIPTPAGAKPTVSATKRREESPEIEVVSEKKISTPGLNVKTPTVQKVAPAFVPASHAALLNILARPINMHPVSIAVKDRKELDGMVKAALVKSQQGFVEWLFGLQLLKDRMMCHKHPDKPVKLGLFQMPSILPSSGGYVWLSDCCSHGTKFVSIYSGSIFAIGLKEGISATSVLKLIYHWSCQTTVTNVENWVKVSREVIGRCYHYLRCVCSVILQDKLHSMGCHGSAVELGVVSLGTTTPDGAKKSVKVEILGLYDRQSKAFRLYASEPQSNVNSAQRFLHILKPVLSTVHHNAVIVCDGSIDKTSLPAMNYKKLVVCQHNHDGTREDSNSTIMSYLRKHVPKMFQNSLSTLTLEQVQLVLDELCWRETFGRSPSHSYINMMQQLAYLTYRETENNGLLCLLDFLAHTHSKCWRYVADSAAPPITLPPSPNPSLPSKNLYPLPAVIPINRSSAPAVHPAFDVDVNDINKNLVGVPQTIDVHPNNVISPVTHENKVVLTIVNNEIRSMRNTSKRPKPIRLEPASKTPTESPKNSTKATIKDTPTTTSIVAAASIKSPAPSISTVASGEPSLVTLDDTTTTSEVVSNNLSSSLNLPPGPNKPSTPSGFVSKPISFHLVNNPVSSQKPILPDPAPVVTEAASVTGAVSINNLGTPLSNSAIRPPPASNILQRSAAVPSNHITAVSNPASPIPTPSPVSSASVQSCPSPALSSSSSVVECITELQPGKTGKDLVSYYYGEVPGDSSVAREDNLCKIECHVCQASYIDNVEFYEHLKSHLFEKGLLGRVICPYCILSYSDDAAVAIHVERVHNPERMNDLLCRICMMSFETEEYLIRHMADKHVEAELPYRCEVCNYATSYYTKAIDHFRTEHRGAPYVQCHFCLLVRVVSPGDVASLSSWFLSHLLEHARGLRCTYCVLTLKNKSRKVMQAHMVTHASYKRRKDLVRYSSSTCKLVIPNLAALSSSRKNDANLSNPITNMRPAVAMSRLLDHNKSLSLNACNNNLCSECKRPLSTPGHYNSYQSCTQCPYATSCSAMMPRHYHVFHPALGQDRTYKMGPPIILPQPLVCCCGFSSNSGHRLATHLALCVTGNKTAYPEDVDDSLQTDNALQQRSKLKLNLAMFVSSQTGGGLKIAEENMS